MIVPHTAATLLETPMKFRNAPLGMSQSGAERTSLSALRISEALP